MWQIILFYVLCIRPHVMQLQKTERSLTMTYTQVQCESFDEAAVRINFCRCHLDARNISVLNINLTYVKQAQQMSFNIRAVRKANVGYRPYLLNYNVDFCEYVKNSKHPILRIVLQEFKEFSNMNHTCPYVGDIVVKNSYLNLDKIKLLPIPKGDYGTFFTWTVNRQKAYEIKVYFSMQ